MRLLIKIVCKTFFWTALLRTACHFSGAKINGAALFVVLFAFFAAALFLRERLKAFGHVLLPKLEAVIEPNFGELALLIACYIFNNIKDDPSGARFSYYAFFACTIGLLLYRNLEAAERYVDARRPSTKIEAERLYSVSRKMSVCYACLVGGVLAFLSLLRTSGISAALWRALKAFFAWLSTVIHFQADDGGEAGFFLQEEQMTQAAETPFVAGDEPSALASLLDKIVYYGGLTLSVLLLIAVFIALLRWLVVFLYERRNRTDDAAEFINPFEEREKVEKRPRTRPHLWFAQSPAERVRKIYGKNLKRAAGKDTYALSHRTPAQQLALWEETSSDKPGGEKKDGAKKDGETGAAALENAARILQIYERARYGKDGGGVTGEDAKEIKKRFAGGK